jgi:outer membrane translocation and assembly module TamA
VILDWSLERRRSPLRPRAGHHAFARVEFADPALGGEARYQRLEAGGSWHRPLSRSLFLHVGLWQGVVTDFSGADDEVPFNKRFFPGGANSVRGYQHGEASPVDARGNQLGAASSIVGNLELEKALTRAWSVVGFLDGVANAQDMDQFPGDEFLASVGAGVRWNTPVGPVRLEYGYNLNPRAHDPPGTLHVSVGFPF